MQSLERSKSTSEHFKARASLILIPVRYSRTNKALLCSGTSATWGFGTRRKHSFCVLVFRRVHCLCSMPPLAISGTDPIADYMNLPAFRFSGEYISFLETGASHVLP